MKVLTAAEFQKCPKGTVFAYGEPWCFSSLLVLHDVHIGNGFWYFYATDPMWVEGDGTTEFGDLDEMLETGCSKQMNTSSTKYASYDGGKMDCFLVLEPEDWARLTDITVFSD